MCLCVCVVVDLLIGFVALAFSLGIRACLLDPTAYFELAMCCLFISSSLSLSCARSLYLSLLFSPRLVLPGQILEPPNAIESQANPKRTTKKNRTKKCQSYEKLRFRSFDNEEYRLRKEMHEWKKWLKYFVWMFIYHSDFVWLIVILLPRITHPLSWHDMETLYKMAYDREYI